MKRIALIIFTFSGNYTGYAQKTDNINDSVNVKQNVHENVRPVKKDSVVVEAKASVRLFPNPAKNKVEIEIRGFDPGNVQVQLLGKNGNIIKDDKRLLFSGNEKIILMFSEKPGIYFLMLKQGKNNLRSKLIIQ